MTIRFTPCHNLHHAAAITFDNMRESYARFAPDWDADKVYQVTQSLDNYDILSGEKCVGVMRLEFFNDHCMLRDLQVIPQAQNKGIGMQAILHAKDLCEAQKLPALKLRVLSTSPAKALYERAGFTLEHKDAQFLYMSLAIA